MQYYAFYDGQKHGPFTLEQLATQQFPPDVKIWRKGLSGWLSPNEVPELQGQLQVMPPPNPVPAQTVAPRPAASFSPPMPGAAQASKKIPVWLWIVGAVAGVCILGCGGLSLLVIIAAAGSGESGSGPTSPVASQSASASLNVAGRDGTQELQSMFNELTDEQKAALGISLLATGADFYAATVQITNTGSVPIRIFPENLRVHFGQETANVFTIDDPRFLHADVLQPGYSLTGLVTYRARVDIGAAMRQGEGGLSYEDPSIQVTYEN